MKHAPNWWQHRSALAYLFWPLSKLYGAIAYWRFLLVRPQHVSVPVICVGNATAGGTGKTPTVMALVEELISCDHQPHIISRGYGGTVTETTMVNTLVHTAAQVGDEPLLLAKHAPCWVGADRVASAQAAIESGATILVMDDGMQNSSLYKDVIIMVMDGEVGFGNGWLLPAGPCREKPQLALSRANMLLVMGQATHLTTQALSHPQRYNGNLQADDDGLTPDQPYYAFAGIGRPQKFFDTLQSIGMTVIGAQPFPDHYPYTTGDIQSIIDQAHAKDALPITTEKDLMRIDVAYRPQIKTLPVSLRLEERDAFFAQLHSLLEARAA